MDKHDTHYARRKKYASLAASSEARKKKKKLTMPLLKENGDILLDESSGLRLGRSRATAYRPAVMAPEPSCRFFAPAASLKEGLSAEAPDDWPYATLLDQHGCCCPARNKDGHLFCVMYQQQSHCNFYEPAPVEMLLGREAAEKRVELRKSRVGMGVPKFEVFVRDGETTSVTNTVTNDQHSGDGYEVALSLYQKSLEEHELTDATEIADETPLIPSYLRSLMETDGEI